MTSRSLNQPMYVSASSLRGGRRVHFSPRRTGPNIGSLGARTPMLYDELFLRDRQPPWTRSLEAPRRDQFSQQRPLNRPAEPLPHLVLVREYRRAHADQHELGEGLLLIRLPRLVPHLVPSRELARVAMTALAVVDGDVTRHHGAERFELLTHLAKCGRRETELGLHVVDLRWTRGSQMANEPRSLVARGVGLRERRAGERVDRAHGGLMAEKHLAPMHLKLADAGTQGELAAQPPRPLQPRAEAA